MLQASIDFPDLVLPMMKIEGENLTSFGIAQCDSRALGFLTVYSLYYSSLRQQILSLQIRGQVLGYQIREQGLSFPNLLSFTIKLFKKSGTLCLQIGSILFFSHLLILSSMKGFMAQFILSVTCLTSLSHFTVITYTPQPLKASVYSSNFALSASLCALSAYYL